MPGRWAVGEYVSDGVVGPGCLDAFCYDHACCLLFCLEDSCCIEGIVGKLDETCRVFFDRLGGWLRWLGLHDLGGVDAASNQFSCSVLLPKRWAWCNHFEWDIFLYAELAEPL